jgi:hypothetical protein
VCSASQCVGGEQDGYGCVAGAQCPGGACVTADGGGAGDEGDTCSADADCKGACVPCAPPFDLDQIDFVLPGLSSCVSPSQSIAISQVGCATCDPVLSCFVTDRDPSCPADLCAPGTGTKFCEGGSDAGKACTHPSQCDSDKCTLVPCQPITDPDPLKVAKCVITSGNLDKGECITVELKIGGEQPQLGPGAIDELTKAGFKCTTDSLCGPSCGCDEKKGCLTRTPGFWGTHPHVTSQFLPITVCGKSLSTVAAGQCGSAVEAMCVSPGSEGNRTCDKNPGYAQLVRQLAAAKLNILASTANGGTCGAAISTRITQCERLCGASSAQISNSRCIEDLDAFNNSVDSLGSTPPPFDRPGPADATACQSSRGNGLIIGRKCSVDCR